MRPLRVAMVGNANVGKSVIFNELTGLHQHVSNWPGKTVQKAEGTLSYLGCTIDVIDLPGTYSLTTYSGEESVSREYLESEKPDVLVNVIDATALERNLFLTLQLLEMQQKIVVALNQMDAAADRGFTLNAAELSRIIGVPVVPTIGTRSVGLGELMREVVRLSESTKKTSTTVKYSEGIERAIEELTEALRGLDLSLPARWVAIRLLEDDMEYRKRIHASKPAIEDLIRQLKQQILNGYGRDASSVLAGERYTIAKSVAARVTTVGTAAVSMGQRLDRLALNPVAGYVLMVGTLLAMFYGVFTLGDFLSGLLNEGFGAMKAAYDTTFVGDLAVMVWAGLIEGIVAGITVAIPYILPFYVVLSVLEDSGYLARIAFLMDSSMHKIGSHGKGFIPLILGFGCNVPACLSCSIMETKRERLICVFSASLVPCTARSIVIMGLVAAYVGFQWAMLLYVIDFVILFALSRAAFRFLPGEPTGLIMDMPCYRKPVAGATMRRAWVNIKEFVFMAFPIIIVGNLLIQLSAAVGLLKVVEGLTSPVTVFWLGLPAVTGIVLVFGILRKELSLIMLATVLGTTNFALVLSPAQMIVFAFVIMVYTPCLATIAAIAKEFGYRRAAGICVLEMAIAFSVGGVLLRILLLAGFT